MKNMNLLKINKMLNNMKIPTPNNITLMWNYGSLLGMCLILQIVTGMFLAMRYSPDISLAFNSVNDIMNEAWNGFMIRNMHANGASFFFIFLYIHIGRGIYFKSYMMKNTWFMGIIMFFLIMGTAFLGYVLPWGQMSFWGSSVITGLISSIPYLGEYLTKWIWSGYSVSNPTLTRFFCLHFIMPFLLLMLVLIHLNFLHKTGSNNPLGINSNNNKITFNSYFIIKDLMGLMFTLIIFFLIIYYYPYILMDPDNFTLANPMVTPEHIQPEWYFLFAYAILRSIPSKLGGVIALIMSIMILFFLPLLNLSNFNSNKYFFFSKSLFWLLVMTMLLLTWIGMKPVEYPFIIIGQFLSIMYFMTYFMISISDMLTNKLINF